MTVRFEGFEIDFDRVEIRRDDAAVDVQPQVFTVIEYLYEHRDRVVTKEELLDNVWNDRFVSESALTSRIKLARRAVGDDGQSQSVIRTVQGRGYRFVANPLQDVASADRVEARPVEAPSASGRNVDPWPFVGRDDVIEQIDQHVRAGAPGVVVVAGSSGSGRSSVLERWASSYDGALLRIAGNPATRDIPLAGVMHVLFGSASAVTATDRAELFRIGYEAVARVLDVDESRLPSAIVVDDVHHLDEATAAVVAAAVSGGLAQGVISLRTPGCVDPTGLSEAGGALMIRLGPLDEIDMEVAVYRTLPGPIDDESLHMLIRTAAGSPSDLRDAVETSRATGVLVNRDGVWFLDGPPARGDAQVWQPEALSEAAIDAARRLALVPPQRLDLAIGLVGETSLDELDAAGVLRIDGHDDAALVHLHPAAVEGAVDSMGPLLQRRLQRELAATLCDVDDAPTLARLMSWGSATGIEISANTALKAVFGSLQRGDLAGTDRLVTHLDPHQVPEARAAELELAYRRAQWGEATRLAELIEPDGLSDRWAALALRRTATLRFDRAHQHQQAIDELAEAAARLPSPVAEALRARRLGLLALDERHDDVLAEAPDPDGLTPVPRIEVLLALAAADVQQGRFTDGLARAATAARVIEQLPVGWRNDFADMVLSLQCAAHYSAGDMRSAFKLIEDHLPAGRRTPFLMLPVFAADTALMAGRHRLVRQLSRPALAGSRRHVSPVLTTLAESIAALGDLGAGRAARAEHAAANAEAAMEVAPALLRTRLALTWARLLHVSGRGSDAVDRLLRLADDAADRGSRVSELMLLADAATVDETTRTAQTVAARVAEVGSGVEGRLWPIVVDEINARARGDDLHAVAAAYGELGLHALGASVLDRSTRQGPP